METRCVRIPLKAGKTEPFLAWIQSLSGREDEMLEAMQMEGVAFEAIFLERGEQGDSIVFYMRAADLNRAQTAFAESTLSIDVETRDMIAACWDTARAALLTPCIELEGQPLHAK